MFCFIVIIFIFTFVIDSDRCFLNACFKLHKNYKVSHINQLHLREKKNVAKC